MRRFIKNKLSSNVILNLIQSLNVCLLIIAVMFMFSSVKVSAYDLDTSVNSEIEQKYDSDKLNKDMGVNTSGQVRKSSKKAPKTTPSFDNSTPSVSNSSAKSTSTQTKAGTKIPSGTKFIVKSNNAVSGSSGVNTMLSFTSTYGVYINGLTIPAGTVFKGYVENSHTSQITGNGGLIEIKIISMTFNGKTTQIEGKITKANSKNVFLNNIKGKRQYLTNVGNQLKKGVNIYNKIHNVSSVIPNNPVNKVLSPVSAVVGAAGTLTNTVISPVIAVFKKGQNISLPAGTTFEIKLTNDAYVE